MIDPDLVTELATRTVISDETLAGGAELFPGSLDEGGANSFGKHPA